jgi:hypothetical protein
MCSYYETVFRSVWQTGSSCCCVHVGGCFIDMKHATVVIFTSCRLSPPFPSVTHSLTHSRPYFSSPIFSPRGRCLVNQLSIHFCSNSAKFIKHCCVFSGVGIVLITVSGIAWRLTSTDSPSCAAMLGIGAGGGFCGLGGVGGDDEYSNGGGGRFLVRPGDVGGGGGGGGAGGGGGNGGSFNGNCAGNRTTNAQHPYAGE